ncbi:uncharacterized protein LOC126766735 [Bactrocera neohumeralis]|uniref:uncharacterized protein LOC126766735 n=1 Tax=Bactrocera neohumeralis TaxID=98809 RepID=UPI002164F73A|nr:uncharacterized protein LOC126766735 [Bactrocera neohumeralis]
MDTGVLERIRSLEADIERCIESVVQQELFSQDVTNERHRILLDHFQLEQLKTIRGLSEKLLDIYLDEDEIVEAQEAPGKGEEAIASAVKKFEGKVADLREYHLTYRTLPAVKNQLAMPNPKILDTLFAVNERYGSCLDLATPFNQHCTFMISTAAMATTTYEGEEVHLAMRRRIAAWASTWPSRLEYFRFVPELPELVVGAVDATRKLTGFAMYKDFVTGLLTYLNDFYHRVHPLSTEEVPRLLTEAENGCEEFWSALTKESDDVKVISDAYGKEDDSDSADDGDGEGSHGSEGRDSLTAPSPPAGWRFRRR